MQNRRLLPSYENVGSLGVAALFRYFLVKTFWRSYDALGRLVALNVIVFLSLLPFLWLAQRYSFWFLFAAVPPLLVLGAGLFHFCREALDDRDATVETFWSGIRLHGWSSLTLGLVILFFACVLVSNLVFYLNSPMFSGGLRFLGITLAGFCFWLLVFLAMVSFYAFPLMVAQSVGPLAALKRAALIALGNPGFTLAALIFYVSVVVIGCVSLVGPVILLISLYAMMSTCGLAAAIRAYEQEARKAEQPVEGGAKESSPTSWREIREDEAQARDDEDPDMKRSLRELLKPWES